MSLSAMVWAWKVQDITSTEKLVLLCLADASNHENKCWPSQKFIADKCSLKRVTVNRAISTLADKKLIDVENRTTTRGKSSNVYFLAVYRNVSESYNHVSESDIGMYHKDTDHVSHDDIEPSIEPPNEPKKDSPPIIPPREDPPDAPKGGPDKKGKQDDRRKRGSRLPADWRPDAECRAFADSLGVDADRTADEFRDYWASVPGSKGTKLDWPATWRNWCRRAAGSGAQRPPRANGNQRGAASWSKACDNVLERIKGAPDGRGNTKNAQDFEGKDDPPVGRCGGYGNSDLGLFGGIDEVSGVHSAPCLEGTAEEVKVVPFVVRTGRGT